MGRTALMAGLAALIASVLTSCTQPGQSALSSCVKPGDHAQFVTYRTSTGESVTAAVLGTGSLGFVLAPKVIDNACVWLPYARTLRDRGDRALLFDWGTTPLGQVTGAAAVAEVVAAAGELRREGSATIFLIGASKGGTACLVAASEIRPAVAGVASLSGEASYQGMDAMRSADSLTLPVLFMAADNDALGSGSPDDARAMFAASPSPDKQLVMLHGTEHGEELLAGGSRVQANRALDSFIVRATS